MKTQVLTLALFFAAALPLQAEELKQIGPEPPVITGLNSPGKTCPGTQLSIQFTVTQDTVPQEQLDVFVQFIAVSIVNSAAVTHVSGSTYRLDMAVGQTSGTGRVTVRANDRQGTASQKDIYVNVAKMKVTVIEEQDVSCNGTANGRVVLQVADGFDPDYDFSWNTSPTQQDSILSGVGPGTYTCTVTDNPTGCTQQIQVDITEPPVLTASITNVVDPSCKGAKDGQATSVVAGGVKPYFYYWNSDPFQVTATATGLGAGIYTCTVRDSMNCLKAVSVTLTDPEGGITLTRKQVLTQPQCRNSTTGSAFVQASGGTGTLSYRWNTNPVQTTQYATQLSAGTYICRVSDATGRCPLEEEVVITAINAFDAVLSSKEDLSCNGAQNGSATVEASGSTNYSYAWNDPATQTTATAEMLDGGDYVCTVRDIAGCTIRIPVSINEPKKLQDEQTLQLCPGEIYTLQGGEQLSKPGTYVRTFPHGPNNCDSTIILHLIRDRLDQNIDLTPEGLKAREQRNNTQYQWFDCNTLAAIPGADKQIFLPQVEGDFAAWIDDPEHCPDTTVCYHYKPGSTKVAEHVGSSSLNLYPNPSKGFITIAAASDQQYEIRNALGQVVQVVFASAGQEQEINLNGLENGVYYVFANNSKLPARKLVLLK